MPEVTHCPPPPAPAGSHRRGRRRGVFLLLLAAAALAGCASKDVAPACPRVAVLNSAGSLTRFAPGPGRDILDIDFQADMGDVVSACRDDQSRNDRPVSLVVLAPVLIASRGPANRDHQARFSYFVSVVDSGQQILTKQIFPVEIDFSGNRNRVVLRDDDPPITVDVPNPKGVGARAYEILVGFQLTQDEIDYNRKRAAAADVGGALIPEPGSIQ